MGLPEDLPILWSSTSMPVLEQVAQECDESHTHAPPRDVPEPLTVLPNEVKVGFLEGLAQQQH